jgi:hypothetical protein
MNDPPYVPIAAPGFHQVDPLNPNQGFGGAATELRRRHSREGEAAIPVYQLTETGPLLNPTA